MTLPISQILVLSAFFDLAQQDRAVTRLRLASATGLSRTALHATLIQLAAGGWVTVEPLALTLPGLALAVAALRRAPRRYAPRSLAA